MWYYLLHTLLAVISIIIISSKYNMSTTTTAHRHTPTKTQTSQNYTTQIRHKMIEVSYTDEQCDKTNLRLLISIVKLR